MVDGQHVKDQVLARWQSCRGRLGAFDQDAAAEDGPGADQGDQVRAVDGTPAVLGCLDELERHRQVRRPRPRPFGDLGPVADRGEARLGLVVRRCTQFSAG